MNSCQAKQVCQNVKVNFRQQTPLNNLLQTRLIRRQVNQLILNGSKRKPSYQRIFNTSSSSSSDHNNQNIASFNNQPQQHQINNNGSLSDKKSQQLQQKLSQTRLQEKQNQEGEANRQQIQLTNQQPEVDSESKQEQEQSQQQLTRNNWLKLGQLICKELGLFQDVDKFKVPWGVSSIIKVLFWWITSFLFVGQCFIPYGCKLLDIDRNNLNPRGAATLHLLLDTLQIAITYIILALELRPYKPYKQKIFPFRFRPVGWLLLVVVGCLLFPCVDWLALLCSRWFPIKEDNWVENIEQSFQIGDAMTHSLYLFVVSLCAPLWEETIFRGFLIPSLTRYMPLGISVVFSSLIFGLAHFSLQRVLPLMLLGIVIGTVYVASGNLLSAVVLHSLWNFWVFWQLFAQHVVGQDQWSFTSFVVKLVATLWSACNGIWP
eukprot:TRINITY_DN13232_c1_g1_i1.p1 TRINITY_DN13232_c1_g1~~TRINITY_DN13232_c1_g1_i1.p1  ORF type:complete len:432 (-),score=37.61 TRINITY_DN13232_c1_g1_i1:875-2170(-)